MALVRPSTENIVKFLNLQRESASSLYKILNLAERAGHKSVDQALEIANKTIGGYGVEAIRSERFFGGYYADIAALYVNMGDTYVESVIFETQTEKFYIGSWGDWVEYKGKKYRVS